MGGVGSNRVDSAKLSILVSLIPRNQNRYGIVASLIIINQWQKLNVWFESSEYLYKK